MKFPFPHRKTVRSFLPQRPNTAPAGFYVYALSVDGVVRYIGKGAGFRAWDHFDCVAMLLTAAVRGDASRYDTPIYRLFVAALARHEKIGVEIVASGMTEDAAFQRERHEIKSRGRVAVDQCGTLWNLADGGAGIGSAYAVRRAAHRRGESMDRDAKRNRPPRAPRHISDNAFGPFGGSK